MGEIHVNPSQSPTKIIKDRDYSYNEKVGTIFHESEDDQSDNKTKISQLSYNDLIGENMRLNVHNYIREHIYKLSNMFLIPFFATIIVGLIAYNNHINSKLFDVYAKVYQTELKMDELAYQKLEDRIAYINELEKRIIQLEEKILHLQQGEKAKN